MIDRGLTAILHDHPDGPAVLTVSGELDHHTAPRLRAALDGVRLEPGMLLVIDLTRLTYCDSTGITVLITAYHRVQDAGASLALAGLNPDLTRVFTIVGLNQIFASHPDVGSAVRAHPRPEALQPEPLQPEARQAPEAAGP